MNEELLNRFAIEERYLYYFEVALIYTDHLEPKNYLGLYNFLESTKEEFSAYVESKDAVGLDSYIKMVDVFINLNGSENMFMDKKIDLMLDKIANKRKYIEKIDDDVEDQLSKAKESYEQELKRYAAMGSFITEDQLRILFHVSRGYRSYEEFKKTYIGNHKKYKQSLVAKREMIAELTIQAKYKAKEKSEETSK